MATKLADQLRVTRRHGIQCIANMEARHRTRRALEHAFASIGKGDGRAVITLFQARGEDADHALVPVRLEQAQAERHRLQRQVLELGQGFALHALLDGLAVLVQFVELAGDFPCQVGIVTEQALDAQAHVVQAPGGIEPRAEDKAKVGGGDARMIAPGHFKDGLEPRPGPPGTDAFQALMDQDTIVGIQRHHVSHAAQGHQIEQLADVRLRRVVVMTEAAQTRSQGHQHIEDHPDPGQRLAGKLAARLVGIDDGVCRRQFMARQVVIGHQYFQARSLGGCHAFDAGDAVVDGDQQLRLALQGHLDDLRGQAIAVLEAVGHQVIDMGGTEQTQAEYTDGTGRGAVSVEVADDEDALAFCQCRHQQVDRRLDALELLVRQQARQAFIQLGCRLHAAGGIQAGQQRWQVAKEWQRGRQRAGIDTHGAIGASRESGMFDRNGRAISARPSAIEAGLRAGRDRR
ncbi:hypothetical protein D3C78_363190 [compost metagenome]